MFIVHFVLNEHQADLINLVFTVEHTISHFLRKKME